ncbi:DUF4145 domain-containing protein [Kitasatospora sp. NPDC094019]|uniref:DUF4145 domain-containing protein n=1 Tax=Kitasatospora sp. NPDC094019 TaxID=3364091 RepID=UPI003808C261
MSASSGKTAIAYCSTCRVHRSMTAHGEVTEQPNDDIGREDPARVILATCDGCGSATVLIQYLFAGHETELEPVWPTAYQAIPAAVPHKVAMALLEARRCFELAHAYAAAATMVRRAVELVCKDHGIDKGNLAANLTALEQAGTIDGRLLEWAHSLRFLGNDGAHGDKVTRQDAEDGLALAEALVEYVYVLAVKHNEFQQRRAAAKAKPAPMPAQGAGSASAASTPS